MLARFSAERNLRVYIRKAFGYAHFEFAVYGNRGVAAVENASVKRYVEIFFVERVEHGRDVVAHRREVAERSGIERERVHRQGGGKRRFYAAVFQRVAVAYVVGVENERVCVCRNCDIRGKVAERKRYRNAAVTVLSKARYIREDIRKRFAAERVLYNSRGFNRGVCRVAHRRAVLSFGRNERGYLVGYGVYVRKREFNPQVVYSRVYRFVFELKGNIVLAAELELARYRKRRERKLYFAVKLARYHRRSEIAVGYFEVEFVRL